MPCAGVTEREVLKINMKKVLDGNSMPNKLLGIVPTPLKFFDVYKRGAYAVACPCALWL